MTVASQKSFGKYLEQTPFFMQTHLSFISPHGPCIINSETKAYPRGSSNASGISADINELIFSTPISPLPPIRQTSICACGSPRFWNSTVYRTEKEIKKISQRLASKINKRPVRNTDHTQSTAAHSTSFNGAKSPA